MLKDNANIKREQKDQDLELKRQNSKLAETLSRVERNELDIKSLEEFTKKLDHMKADNEEF